MPRKNVKKKGNNFELDISKKLSLWWTDNERSDVFYKTTNSGGIYTINEKTMYKNDAGDIKSIDVDSKAFTDYFIIECKSYEDINLWSIVTESNDLIGEWWDKLLIDCNLQEKTPLLIIKQDYKPILLITTERFSNKLNMVYGNEIKPKLIFYKNDKEIHGFKLNDILKLNIKYIKTILEEL